MAESSEPRLRVLIAEDQYLMREGTKRLLEEAPGIDVVGEASDYESVLAESRRLEEFAGTVEPLLAVAEETAPQEMSSDARTLAGCRARR